MQRVLLCLVEWKTNKCLKNTNLKYLYFYIVCFEQTASQFINDVKRVVTIRSLLLGAERGRVFLGQLFICLEERVEFIKLGQKRSYMISTRILKRVST